MARTVKRSTEKTDPHARDVVELGKLVRNRRTDSDLGIVDAADQLGISKSALSRLENGQSVNLDTAFKVLNGLGLNMLVVTKGEAAKVARLLNLPQDAC